MTGIDIALTVLLIVAVLVIVMILIHKAQPTSTLSKAEDKAWTDIQRGAGVTEAFFINEADALAAGYKKVVPTVQAELQSLLTAAEKRLTSLEAEAEKDAQAEKLKQEAADSRSLKLALIQTHIAALQAHVAAQQ